MGRSQLQGIPWHEEQIKRTCKNGSKYCIYNRNICTCTHSKFHHKKCVGKGECDDFESKGGTPKIVETKTKSTPISIPQNNHVIQNKPIKKGNKTMNNTNDNTQKESKEEKFLRISKGRIDKIEEAISNLENLSDKYSYSYTDKQVDKMFNYLEERLKTAKGKFLSQNSGGFEW